MVVVPQTDIKLIKMPLHLDYKNQLTFNNLNEQLNYFNSLPYLELDGATYQRKDGFIRFNKHIDELIKYNYCMYKNESYSNKWFFAFIIGMQYINDNCTFIIIETDVFQTWQFDINIKQSFVEREMINVADDIPR